MPGVVIVADVHTDIRVMAINALSTNFLLFLRAELFRAALVSKAECPCHLPARRAFIYAVKFALGILTTKKFVAALHLIDPNRIVRY